MSSIFSHDIEKHLFNSKGVKGYQAYKYSNEVIRDRSGKSYAPPLVTTLLSDLGIYKIIKLGENISQKFQNVSHYKLRSSKQKSYR